MKAEGLTPPRFPVTWTEAGHTGLVWAWIFWWCRHGLAWVEAADSPQERKRRNRTLHSVQEELDTELTIMIWQRLGLPC